MTASPDLFNIIKSLTASEKRYFKIFASRHVIGGKNNYEKLFDAFDGLEDDKPYDEACFKKALRNKSWVKNFAVEKSLLCDLLLKAMRSYHAEKTAKGKLEAMVADFRFLYDKGLIEAARKTLDEALEFAKEQNDLAVLISLYHFKLRIPQTNKTVAETEGEDTDFEAETRALKMLDAERRTSHIRRRVYNLYISGKLAGSSAETKSLLSALDMIEENMPLTLDAKLNNLNVRAMIFERDGRYAEALELYNKVILLLEKEGSYLQDSLRYIRTTLGNYLACAHYLEKFSEFPVIISKIEKLPAETVKDKVETFRLSKQYRLVYYLNTDEQEGCDELVAEINKDLGTFRNLLSLIEVVKFRNNICLLYFKQKKYNKFILAINDANEVIGRNESLRRFARDLKFLEAAVHINMKNFSMVDYHLKNLERWLRENQLNNDFSSLLIKTFRQMLDPDGPKNINGQLAEANCPRDMEMLKEVITQWW